MHYSSDTIANKYWKRVYCIKYDNVYIYINIGEKQFFTRFRFIFRNKKKDIYIIVLKFIIDCRNPYTHTHTRICILYIYSISGLTLRGVCNVRIHGATDFYRFRFPRTRLRHRSEPINGQRTSALSAVCPRSRQYNNVRFPREFLSIRSARFLSSNLNYSRRCYVIFAPERAHRRCSDGERQGRVKLRSTSRGCAGLFGRKSRSTGPRVPTERYIYILSNTRHCTAVSYACCLWTVFSFF